MRVLDWLKNDIVANGLLCEEYIALVNNAKSKKQLFDICADANGVSFLCEMRDKGHGLPYYVIQEEFGNYINGKYIAEYEKGYTSAIYCGSNGDIEVETTLACFLGCHGRVYLRPYSVTRICVDCNCYLEVECPANARLTIEYYGEGSTIKVIESPDIPEMPEGKGNIKLKKMS